MRVLRSRTEIAAGDVRPHVVFGLLITLTLALAVALGTPEPRDDRGVPAGHGVAHPVVTGMAHGAAGAARYAPIAWPAAIFAAGLVALAAVVAHSGIRPRVTQGTVGGRYLSRLVIAAGAAGVFVMAAIFLTYEAYVEAAEVEYFGGLPTPTAWAVYGVAAFGVVPIVGWVLLFRREVWPARSRERFASLLRDRDVDRAEGE